MKTAEMKQCIDQCVACWRVCTETASDQCLEMGGRHVEPAHFRLMMACAETCRAAATAMMWGVAEHRSVCAACAELCEACAASCAEVGDMEACVDACRRCAESCRRMAG